MRVMQMVSGTGLNGAVRHCYDLSCQLAKRGHDVWLAHRSGSWISKQRFSNRVTLVETSLHRDRSELNRIAGIATQERVDVLHSHNSSSHFFGVLLARGYGLRCVATCHMPHFQPHWWWNDRVIAPTQPTAKFQNWVNWVPRSRIDVIPYFIEPERLSPTQSIDEINRELRIDPDDFVFSIVGEVCSRKSQLTVIESLPALINAGISPTLLLAGKLDPAYGAKCQKAIQKLGLSRHVRLLGQQKDVTNLLAISRCVCLPSKREVLPLSLLEAMSVGVPVITTAVGGIADCIRDGVDGFIVKRSTTEFGDALLTLSQNAPLRERLGENARQNMRSQFSAQACVSRIEATYQAASAKRAIAA